MKIILIGAGVANINLVTKLVDNGYEGEIIIIDKGKDPYHRLPEETMEGMLGCGGWSDGKLTYHTEIGGHLSKYCGEDKAMELMDQVITNFRRFHPKPELIHCSHPTEEPTFIKPYFGLRLFPVWHIGTDYLLQIAQNWYNYLVDKGVKFLWECEVIDINFYDKIAYVMTPKANLYEYDFDKLIFGVGKSGIDLSKKLLEKYKIELEQKPAQIGVRFEAPQKYFQKLIDVSYDFKLYRKDDKVSVRSFCLPETEEIQVLDKGFISIKDITIQDKVLVYDFYNKKTEWTKVNNIFQRKYKGNLITINEHLTTTEDHILYIWEKEKIKNGYTKEKNPNRRHNDDAFVFNKIKEVKAKDLKLGDNLVTPIGFKREYKQKYTKYSNQQLWMFGLWFADGSGNYNSKWNSNGFTLTNESYIIDKYIGILKENNESYSSKKDYDNYSILNFNSPRLKEFLINENCFKKGKKRGLPQSIKQWSEEEIYSFLSGMIDGDGRVKKEHSISIEYFTSSEKLIRDLSYLFLDLGILNKVRFQYLKTNFTKGQKVKNYIIRIQNIEYVKYLAHRLHLNNIKKSDLLYESLNLNIKPQNRKNYEKIKDLKLYKFEGLVYDIETNINHNFIAGKSPIVIHNCTNNGAAFVAVEETYGDISYNGHAKKDEKFRNDMTNFGILMEIKSIENPFEWARKVVDKCQYHTKYPFDGKHNLGLYYSPSRNPSKTSENKVVLSQKIYDLKIFEEAFGIYANYIISFIEDMNKVFNFGDDWGMYIPEVKYLTGEPLVNYDNLELKQYSGIYFVGDALSARGITVSGAQGIYVAESILKSEKYTEINETGYNRF